MLDTLVFRAFAALLEQTINGKCDGNRNLIHKAVSCCFPATSSKTKSNGNSKQADKDSIAQGKKFICLDVFMIL